MKTSGLRIIAREDISSNTHQEDEEITLPVGATCEPPPLDIDINKFSALRKLLRITAMAYKMFKSFINCKKINQSPLEKTILDAYKRSSRNLGYICSKIFLKKCY